MKARWFLLLLLVVACVSAYVHWDGDLSTWGRS
jgi:hypothetical protein